MRYTLVRAAREILTGIVQLDNIGAKMLSGGTGRIDGEGKMICAIDFETVGLWLLLLPLTIV